MCLAAAEALGRIRDPRAVEPLIAALKLKKLAWDHPTAGPERRYREVCLAAAKALGNLGDARAVKPLIARLRREDRLVRSVYDETWDASVRKTAAFALADIGAPSVEPLITALRDENDSVRNAAAMALGLIGDPGAVERLNTGLGDGAGRG
ncbi:MAG: HEAT repeat domain-containing protein, partial [Anaerolineales bacterium]